MFYTMGGIDPQVDWDRGDAPVGPGNAVRLGLNLQPDLVEVGELLPLAVQELCPFWKNRKRNRRRMSWRYTGGVGERERERERERWRQRE